jgi:hypothetical protein
MDRFPSPSTGPQVKAVDIEQSSYDCKDRRKLLELGPQDERNEDSDRIDFDIELRAEIGGFVPLSCYMTVEQVRQ